MTESLESSLAMTKEAPLSVSEYISRLNTGLKEFGAKIYGETIGVSKSKKGHVYFTLKDQKDEAVLDCMIWKEDYTLFGVEIKDGREVEITGFPNVYAPWGKLRFMVQAVSLRGEGALKKAYEKLKAKLAKEGLLDEERKRPIPKYPKKVGVITSLTSGVVIHDFLSNLGKFGFEIKAIDTQVEGLEAVRDILSALKVLEKEDIEVLVIMRGGGSLQSLSAFDNEVLARKVSSFPIPVIAAIGHHVDIPLVAMVADRAVSTPITAADVLSKSWEDAKYLVERCENKILGQYDSWLDKSEHMITGYISDITDGLGIVLDNYRAVEKRILSDLSNLDKSILSTQSLLKKNVRTIVGLFESTLQIEKNKYESIAKLIESNNPLRQLGLGYSIVSSSGRIVKRVVDLSVGETVDMLFSDGQAQSEIKKVQYKKGVVK